MWRTEAILWEGAGPPCSSGTRAGEGLCLQPLFTCPSASPLAAQVTLPPAHHTHGTREDSPTKSRRLPAVVYQAGREDQQEGRRAARSFKGDVLGRTDTYFGSWPLTWGLQQCPEAAQCPPAEPSSS